MSHPREQKENPLPDVLLALALAVVFAIPLAWIFATDALHHVWVAVAFFLLALALALGIVNKKIPVVTRLKQRLELTRAGLREVWPRGTSHDLRRLKSILQTAQAGDEILVLGRTNLAVLKDASGELKTTIQRGATVKMLLLRSAQKADLRQLGYLDGRQEPTVSDIKRAASKLDDDLKAARTLLETLRKSLVSESTFPNVSKLKPGSLLVYETSFVIFNSAVILDPRSKADGVIKIVYDFSFGPNDPDKKDDPNKNKKWAQYYERRRLEGTFVAQLEDFYSKMFNQNSSLLAYSLSYVPGKPMHQVASERMTAIIETHPEAENVRGNPLKKLLPTMAKMFRTMDLEPARRAAPITVQVEVTDRCSTACKHCSRYKGGDQAEDLPVELALSLFDKLWEMQTKTITLSGGEPTQHPKFPDLMRYADKKGFQVGVLSNGVGLTLACREAIRDHASWLRLSIDGGGGDDADVRTPLNVIPNERSAFDQALETLAWFNGHARKCVLGICYTIQRNNFSGLASMISAIRRINPELLTNLTFKFAHAGNDGGTDYVCTPEQIDEILKSVLPLRDKVTGKYPANLGYLIDVIERFGASEISSGTPTKALYELTPTRCFTPYLFSVVDVKGDIYPCCFLYEDNKSRGLAAPLRESHLMGNVSEGFDDVWRGNRYEDLRRDLREISPSKKGYESCGRCTRHCDHNSGLTQLHQEYQSMEKVGIKEAHQALADLCGDQPQEALWL